MSTKPLAALLRENELLRSVASAAIRLRHAGRLCDEYEATINEFWANNPHITRSATMALMLESAFKTEMENFDNAVSKAALAGMDWAHEWQKPAPLPAPPPSKE